MLSPTKLNFRGVHEMINVLAGLDDARLGAAYRSWAKATGGVTGGGTRGQQLQIILPLYPQSVFLGYAGPWLDFRDWLGLT